MVKSPSGWPIHSLSRLLTQSLTLSLTHSVSQLTSIDAYVTDNRSSDCRPCHCNVKEKQYNTTMKENKRSKITKSKNTPLKKEKQKTTKHTHTHVRARARTHTHTHTHINNNNKQTKPRKTSQTKKQQNWTSKQHTHRLTQPPPPTTTTYKQQYSHSERKQDSLPEPENISNVTLKEMITCWRPSSHVHQGWKWLPVSIMARSWSGVVQWRWSRVQAAYRYQSLRYWA